MITRRMDLWERGQHAVPVGEAEAEGAAREGRAALSGEEEEDAVAQSFHETVLSGKLRQAVRRADKICPQYVRRKDTKDTIRRYIVLLPEEKAGSCQSDSE